MKIGIAGCGIGGLAAASLLAEDGHDVTLFDKFDTPRSVGSGLVIQPVGQSVLKACGAAADALAKGQKIRKMEGHEARTGTKVLDVDYDPKGRRFGLAIHRASLFDALLKAALRHGAKIEASSEVVATPEAASGRIFTLQNGSEHGPFDLAIIATGASSPLTPNTGKSLAYGALWSTVPWPVRTSLPQNQLTQRYHHASRMAGVLPIGTLPGETSAKAAFFWSLRVSDMDEWQTRPLAQWKQDVVAFWPEAAPFLTSITRHEDVTKATYQHGALFHPIANRLAFIGDAAHKASPQLGQGANMAMLDAFALARWLSAEPVPQALPLYAWSRRLHVQAYQSFSWAFTPQYQSDSRALPLLRNHILTPLSQFGPFPAILSRLASGNIVTPARGLSLPET